MTSRVLAALTGGLLLLLSVVPGSARAQDWAQTIQILTPVEYDAPVYVFLDSLSAALRRAPETPVRRAAQDATPISFRELQTSLYDDGVDLTSASHVFIRYRFELERGSGSGLIESIEDMYFIFRGNESRSDLPILHVTSTEPVVSDVLTKRGIADAMNIRSVTSFREVMAFLALAEDQDIYVVEMGQRAIRDEYGQERARDLMTHLKDMYFGTGAYALTTDYEKANGASPRRLVSIQGEN
jgi:hypothetical protein